MRSWDDQRRPVLRRGLCQGNEEADHARIETWGKMIVTTAGEENQLAHCLKILQDRLIPKGLPIITMEILLSRSWGNLEPKGAGQDRF